MTKENRKDLLDRIRKILATANNGAATDGEAVAAAEIAALLIDRHGVTPDELDKSAMGEVEDVFVRFDFASPPPDWYTVLSNSMATLFDCLVFLSRPHEIVFVGLEGDGEMAGELLNYLVDHCNAEAQRQTSDREFKSRAIRRTFIASFRYSFALEVRSRIAQMNPQTELTAKRKSHIQNSIMLPKTSPVYASVSPFNAAGSVAGSVAGKEVHLGSDVIKSGATKRITGGAK